MMIRLALLALPLALALPATAADDAAKAPRNASHKALKNEAKGLALATETVEKISPAQMEAAARVLTGRAECEFGQHVDLEAIDAKPGHFKLSFKNVSYTMVPQETTTGAVRLEDKKAGMVWIQIPAKSMLMNAKIGQRVADSCTQSAQRAS